MRRPIHSSAAAVIFLVPALFLFSMLSASADAGPAQAPQCHLSNGALKMAIYLPDSERGFYRGTRFDWSGVIASLEYAGHNYYGPWFTKTDPSVIDFVYRDSDIVAGPCSAITGPVEEFSWEGKALGYDDAKPGGTFLKIGVGVLRKPNEDKYNPYRLYDIVDHGKWKVRNGSDRVEFTQEVRDASSGYGYRYTKVVRLVSGKPEMALEHTLVNTGSRPIQTSVYDHNFLVLERQPPDPDFSISFPFPLKAEAHLDPDLAAIEGSRFIYRRALEGRDTVATGLSGFGPTPADYHLEIENRKVGAGLSITGNRPLSRVYLWSIRSVLSIEPYIDMTIEPGSSFDWKYIYEYRTIGH